MQNIDNMFGSPVVLTPKQLVPKFSSQKGLRMHAIEEIESTKVPAQVDGTAKPGVALSGDLAVILFTSGSTGHSKGVEFTHNQLIESVLAKQQHHPINNTTTFMAWNSFDHCQWFLWCYSFACLKLTKNQLQISVKCTSVPWMLALITSCFPHRMSFKSLKYFLFLLASSKLDILCKLALQLPKNHVLTPQLPELFPRNREQSSERFGNPAATGFQSIESSHDWRWGNTDRCACRYRCHRA